MQELRNVTTTNGTVAFKKSEEGVSASRWSCLNHGFYKDEHVGAGGCISMLFLSILPLRCLSLLEVMLETTRKIALCPGTFSLQLNDEELSKLPGNVTITNGCVLPNIHQHLLPTKSRKGKIDINSASPHSFERSSIYRGALG
ncbi:unnamed protein product [Rhodiola kirilowii]